MDIENPIDEIYNRQGRLLLIPWPESKITGLQLTGSNVSNLTKKIACLTIRRFLSLYLAMCFHPELQK